MSSNTLSLQWTSQQSITSGEERHTRSTTRSISCMDGCTYGGTICLPSLRFSLKQTSGYNIRLPLRSLTIPFLFAVSPMLQSLPLIYYKINYSSIRQSAVVGWTWIGRRARAMYVFASTRFAPCGREICVHTSYFLVPLATLLSHSLVTPRIFNTLFLSLWYIPLFDLSFDMYHNSPDLSSTHPLLPLPFFFVWHLLLGVGICIMGFVQFVRGLSSQSGDRKIDWALY